MKIKNETYYHALALYMIARRRQAEVDKLENEMNELLGLENGSHLSDFIYDYYSVGSSEEFDLALKREGIEFEKN